MYPVRQQTPPWLYWLLQATCAYLLLIEFREIFEVLSRREELAQLIPGSYGARLLRRPFIASALIIFGWTRFFWREREGARIAALMAVIALVLHWVVMYLNLTVNDLHYSAWLTIGYPLAGLVFLTYVIRGRGEEETM